MQQLTAQQVARSTVFFDLKERGRHGNGTEKPRPLQQMARHLSTPQSRSGIEA